MVVPPPVARMGTQQMVPAVALKKRIPKQQLCQRLREDCSGQITVAITVAPPLTPSNSRAVSNVVRLLSIVHLAFLSHHTIVLGFRDDLPHQAMWARGRLLENHNAPDVKASIVEANVRSTRHSKIASIWNAVGKIPGLRPHVAPFAVVCNIQQPTMLPWRKLWLPLNDIPRKSQL